MAILAASARVALFGVAACIFACCCGAASIGVPCSDAAARDGGGVAVVSPALECLSRLCLVTKRDGGTTALCTVECSSDHDCAGMGTIYCRAGYACASVPGFPRTVCACR